MTGSGLSRCLDSRLPDKKQAESKRNTTSVPDRPDLSIFRKWQDMDCYPFSNAATIYDPDAPHDIIELNTTADLEKKPIKSVLPNDTRMDRITSSASTVKELLETLDRYPLITNVKYNVNLLALHRIKPSLEKLDRMVGLSNLKSAILDQILYYTQSLHEIDTENTDFLHTVICGPPGTGKTEVGMVIGEIFTQLGMLKKGRFRKVTRPDLIAGYLGQTGLKTKDVIESSLGGVLFIDEAYSLGGDKKDSFSKECVDILCESMSAYKDDLMVIVAGYENELQNEFFSMNPGLQSRFSWRFRTEKYNTDELMEIFTRKVLRSGWKIEESTDLTSWFSSKGKDFPNFGRDVEILFTKSKISHGRRLFGDPTALRGQLSIGDIEKGFEAMVANRQVLDSHNDFKDSMYT